MVSSGETFTKQFPLITQSATALNPPCLLMGKIIAIDDHGHVSFNLLQHHRSKTHAIQFSRVRSSHL